MTEPTDSNTAMFAKYRVVRGQSFDIMPIPIIPQNVEWFDAGLVSFGVEARLVGAGTEDTSGGGGSLHIFNAEHSREYVRFDCFDSEPHYHFLNHDERQNVVWGYDVGSNGPMHRWALRAIDERLPSLLRSAGADELAARVEADGFDKSVLAGLAEALAAAHARTLRNPALLAESQAWMAQWQQGLRPKSSQREPIEEAPLRA